MCFCYLTRLRITTHRPVATWHSTVIQERPEEVTLTEMCMHACVCLSVCIVSMSSVYSCSLVCQPSPHLNTFLNTFPTSVGFLCSLNQEEWHSIWLDGRQWSEVKCNLISPSQVGVNKCYCLQCLSAHFISLCRDVSPTYKCEKISKLDCGLKMISA